MRSGRYRSRHSAHISYVDRCSKDELASHYPELDPALIVEPDIICDGATLETIGHLIEEASLRIPCCIDYSAPRVSEYGLPSARDWYTYAGVWLEMEVHRILAGEVPYSPLSC